MEEGGKDGGAVEEDDVAGRWEGIGEEVGL